MSMNAQNSRDVVVALDGVSKTYGRALEMLRPIWETDPNRPRYIAKRIAVRLLELCARDRDLLVAVVVLRAKHSSKAEVSLKVGCVLAALVDYIGVVQRVQLDAVVAGLLHQAGQDTHGVFADDAGTLAQRALLGLLMTPTSDPGHYRQVLAAFQHPLGVDGTGVPKMDFPVRQHPLAAMLAVALDFVQMISSQPGRSAQTVAKAMSQLRERAGERYNGALVDVLGHVVGPAPVGSLVRGPDGRNAVVIRYTPSEDDWEAEAVDIEDHEARMVFGPSSGVSVEAVYDALPALGLIR